MENTLSPGWETVVAIYIEVLRNPDASSEAVEAAKAELFRLARIADKFSMNVVPSSVTEQVTVNGIDLSEFDSMAEPGSFEVREH